MKDGVNVNISIESTATDRVQDLFARRATAAGKTVNEISASARPRRHPADGRASDIADLTLFLQPEGPPYPGAPRSVDGRATPGYY